MMDQMNSNPTGNKSEDIGQHRVNKYGGIYQNGKSLPLETRIEIIRRFLNNQKVTSIAADLKVTHGVVSKITQEYKKTNSFLPKTRSPRTIKKKKTNFDINSLLSTPDVPSTSSTRTLFTSEQRTILKDFYEKNKYPSEEEKRILSQKTGLKVEQVTTWFNNKRGRSSKHDKSVSSSDDHDSSVSSISSLSVNSSTSSLESTTSSTNNDSTTTKDDLQTSLMAYQQTLQNLSNQLAPLIQNSLVNHSSLPTMIPFPILPFPLFQQPQLPLLFNPMNIKH